MIALFTESLSRARQIARHLSSTSDEVDGPFRLIRGRLEGADASVFVVEQGADAAYVAARIAQRRGAMRLIPIMEGSLIREAGEEWETGPGQLLPVVAVWNLAVLGPLLRILPDSCADFPLPLEAHLPAKAAWSAEGGGDGAVVGTPPWEIGNRFLGRALFRARGIGIVDRQGSGFAEAVADGDATLHPLCLVSSVLGAAQARRIDELQLARDFDAALESLLPPA